MRLDVDVLAQLVTDYEARVSGRKLQERFGLSKGSVLSLLHEAGVEIGRQPLSVERLSQVVGLYEAGLSIRQVATQLEVPKTTVQDALRRSGVVMRPAVRRQRT